VRRGATAGGIGYIRYATRRLHRTVIRDARERAEDLAQLGEVPLRAEELYVRLLEDVPALAAPAAITSYHMRHAVTACGIGTCDTAHAGAPDGR
jgi:hypothetical protein